MSYHGTIPSLPDVRCLSGPPGPGGPQFLRANWTYIQAPSGIRLDDGRIFLACNGGGLIPSPSPYFGILPGQLPEEVWGILYPQPEHLMGGPPGKYWDLAKWVRMLDLGSADHESYGPSVVQTPASWPDDRRWLMVYTGTEWATLNQKVRQFIGIGWAPDITGPWHHDQTGIPPRNVIPNPPAGIWAVAVLVQHDRVLVIGHDCSVVWPELHEVYELFPDFTYRRLSLLTTGQKDIWLTDCALNGDDNGALFALSGNNPKEYGGVIEWCSDDPWNPDVDTVLSVTGRTWDWPGRLTWDGGYLRDPRGHAVEDTVFACDGLSADPWKRDDWRLQWWTDEQDTAGLLGVEVEPIRLGPVDDKWR